MANPDKLDPLTADFSELRAMPHLNDAVYLSCITERPPKWLMFTVFDAHEPRAAAWARAINALMRTVPL